MKSVWEDISLFSCFKAVLLVLALVVGSVAIVKTQEVPAKEAYNWKVTCTCKYDSQNKPTGSERKCESGGDSYCNFCPAC